MRSKLANILIGTGVTLILAALIIFVHNQRENTIAEESVSTLLPKVKEQMEFNHDLGIDSAVSQGSGYLTDLYSDKMDSVTVEGNEYIGTLLMPSLGMEMPILSDWSQEKLRIAPCRYTGSVRGRGLVLMGHNYASGFGKIANLEIGDAVYFQDVNGRTTAYQVILTDVLSAAAVEEMSSRDYDLTLFTCTYGGANRYAVRCQMIDLSAAKSSAIKCFGKYA